MLHDKRFKTRAFSSLNDYPLPHRLISQIGISTNTEIMTKQKVLFATIPPRREVPDEVPEFAEFSELFEVVVYPLIDVEQFRKALQTDLSDIAAVYITKAFFKHKFNDFIDYLPPTVKVVALPHVGSDRYDVEKIKSRGIKMCNIGDAPSSDVADVALSLALSTFRFTTFWDHAFRESGGDIIKMKSLMGSTDVDSKTGMPLEAPEDRRFWSKHATLGGKFMDSPKGKVAALVGFGSIGKEIAIRLWAIGMKIVYTKRSELTNAELAQLPFAPVYYPTLDEMLPNTDLLVLAVPHTPQTVNLINERTIQLCKKGIRIVNIGRGTAIDEDVLFKALDDGTVNSVGLDVFQHEPHIDKRYLTRHDVTIAPHVGPFTRDNYHYVAVRTMDNIKNILLNGGDGICPI